MESLANALLWTDWDNFANSERGISNDSIFEAILEQDQPCRKRYVRRNNSTEPTVGSQDLEASCQKCTPIAIREFMVRQNQKNGFACQVCKFEDRKMRLGSVVICTTHSLRLCSRSYDSKKIYNKDGDEIDDYSWLAPNNEQSCWEKAHTWYIPKGLFRANASLANQDWRGEKKLKFVNASVSSDIYNARRMAMGHTAVKRGGRGSRPAGRKDAKSKKGKSKYNPGDLVIFDSDDSEALAYIVAKKADEQKDDLSMESSEG